MAQTETDSKITSDYLLIVKDYPGQALLRYDVNGVLYLFKNDWEGIEQDKVSYLIKHTTTEEDLRALQSGKVAKHIKVEELKQEVTFEAFYERYGYKVKKERAKNIWNRMNKAERWRAYRHIPAYEAFLIIKRTAKMYPSTYLNDKPWND